MKRQIILATAVVLPCVATPALSRDQGVINQVNPLEQTMRFYMHPAHLYLSSEAPAPLGEHPAVLVKRRPQQAENAAYTLIVPHPALRGVRPPQARLAQRPFGGFNP